MLEDDDGPVASNSKKHFKFTFDWSFVWEKLGRCAAAWFLNTTRDLVCGGRYGYFPIALSNIQASCSVGNAFSLPTTQQVNDVVPLSSTPAALSNLTVFTAGTDSFQANQQGCRISQVRSALRL